MSSPMLKPALQLWTVRHAAQADLAQTLSEVAKIGYQAVELAGLHGHAPADVRRMSTEHGLHICGAHIGFDVALDELEGCIRQLHTLDSPALIIPTLPRRHWTTEDDALALAGRLNALGAQLSRRDIALVLHNEADEFMPFAGRTLWRVLLANTDPSLVRIQLDLFTAVQAQQQPNELLDAANGRLHSVHVIDWRNGAYTRIGEGLANWRELLSHARASKCEWLIVEHDEPSQPLEDAQASLAALRRFISAADGSQGST